MTSFFQVINTAFGFVSAYIFNDITRPIAEIIKFYKLKRLNGYVFVVIATPLLL